MKTLLCLLSVGVLATAPVALHAKIVRTVEKTFTVQPGGLLKATTQGGDIEVRSTDTHEVRVIARQTIDASSEAKADELLEQLALSMEQQGNEVICEAKYGERQRFRWNFSGQPVRVDFIVAVPKNFNADLKTAQAEAQGKLDAGLFKATINLDLRTSGGDISVGDLNGEVKARTSGGDIKIAKIDGDLTAHTSGGDIYVREGTASAKLHTSGGNVRVERAGGRTEVSTSGGDIRLDEVKELVSARTSGGNIHAFITGPLTDDTELGTSGGDVVVNLRRDIGFQLDARTSGGEVDAEGLTITIDRGGVGKSRLVGTVNGGGPTLKLRSSGGNIDIRTK